MNVLICNDYSDVYGGADSIAIAGAKGLAEKGHKVIFYAPSGKTVSKDLLHSNITVLTQEIPDLLESSNLIRGILNGLWNFKTSSFLNKYLKAFSPNDTVIVIHGWTKCLTASIGKCFFDKRFNPLFFLHDFFIACPNGAFFNFQNQQICHLKPLSCSCVFSNCDKRSIMHKGWRLLRHFIYFHFSDFPCKMKFYAYYSRKTLEIVKVFLPKDSLFYFLRTPVIKEKKERVKAEFNIQYLFIGRLTPEKGPHLFAEAAGRTGIKASFIGNGEFMPEIKAKLPSASFINWLEKDLIFSELRKGRVLVFPSIWHETFGLVVAEALSVGVPVIVSDKCAAAEQVNNGRNGLLFNSGDVEDLIKQIELTSDSLFVQQLSRNAYNSFWADPASLQVHAQDLEKVLESVLCSQN